LDTVYFVLRKVVFRKIFFKFLYVYLLLEKLVNKKYFAMKEKFSLIFIKKNSYIINKIHFLEVMKNLKKHHVIY
jgi:hypothetical protein